VAAFLADLIVLVHFLFVSFCVLGELAILLGAALRWKWIRDMVFRIAHLCTVLFVAAESIFGMICPLTEWEYRLRAAAGQHYDSDMSFLARIVRKIIFYDFPPAFFTALYIGFGALILATFFLIRPTRKPKRDKA
jgi:hypothetical protein